MPDEPIPNSIDDFQNRFDALVLEAKGYGIESIVFCWTPITSPLRRS